MCVRVTRHLSSGYAFGGSQELWEGEFTVLCPELCLLGFVLVARPYDVLACLQFFSAFAVDTLLRKELFPEFSHVCMSGATLNQAAKDLTLVLELCEVFGGIEGWRNPVGNCEPPLTGCFLPISSPC